jgi:hypothetical protein
MNSLTSFQKKEYLMKSKLTHGIFIAIMICAGSFVVNSCNEAPVSDSTERITATHNSGPTNGDEQATPTGAFSVTTSCGAVDILGVEIEQDHSLARLRVRVHPNGLPAVDRVVTTSLNTANTGVISFVGTLQEPDDAVLYQFEYQMIDSAQNWIRIISRQGSDSVIADHRETADRIFETYAVNDEVREFQIRKADMEYAKALCESGLVNGRSQPGSRAVTTPEDKELMSHLEMCREFFTRRAFMQTSVDAQLTLDLLGNDEVVRIMHDGLGRPGRQQQAAFDPDAFCAGAAACALIACEFGPNPVCTICGTVATVCALWYLFD